MICGKISTSWGPSGTHYAGTLVLLNVVKTDGTFMNETDDDGNALQRCEVVDGQQRLATCLLLLDRLRRRLETLEARGVDRAGGIANNIRARYLMSTINKARRPRLSLGRELNEYWVDTVLGDQAYEGGALIAGQSRLKDAKAYFDRQLDDVLSGVADDTQLSRLLDLLQRITAGLAFLVYEVRSDAEIGVIFETLNERGRDLTDLEKVKNYLLYLVRTMPDDRSQQLADQINEAWREIFRNLATQADEAEDQLLRAHWLATQNPDPRLWKRIASVKERFQRSAYVSGATRLVPLPAEDADQEAAWSRLDKDVARYVETLRKCSTFQADLLDPTADYGNFTPEDKRRVRARSGALVRSGVVALYRPLLFAARLRYPDDGAFFAQLIDLCERYSARVFVIEQRRSNAGVSQLARLANELYRGTDRQEVLASVRADLWARAPDDKVRDTLENPSENWYWRRGHKYFLYEYELSQMAEGEEEPLFSLFTESVREQRTTEHILPQTPDNDAACWWEPFSREQHAALVHSLGNLMLTLDNSVYGNHCFAYKRERPPEPGGELPPCYKRGKLHQERQLADEFTEWTPEGVARRQQMLADWALERWAVEAPEGVALAEALAEEAESTPDDETDVAMALVEPA